MVGNKKIKAFYNLRVLSLGIGWKLPMVKISFVSKGSFFVTKVIIKQHNFDSKWGEKKSLVQINYFNVEIKSPSLSINLSVCQNKNN